MLGTKCDTLAMYRKMHNMGIMNSNSTSKVWKACRLGNFTLTAKT